MSTCRSESGCAYGLMPIRDSSQRNVASFGHDPLGVCGTRRCVHARRVERCPWCRARPGCGFLRCRPARHQRLPRCASLLCRRLRQPQHRPNELRRMRECVHGWSHLQRRPVPMHDGPHAVLRRHKLREPPNRPHALRHVLHRVRRDANLCRRCVFMPGGADAMRIDVRRHEGGPLELRDMRHAVSVGASLFGGDLRVRHCWAHVLSELRPLRRPDVRFEQLRNL
jgi:hypothetical protein